MQMGEELPPIGGAPESGKKMPVGLKVLIALAAIGAVAIIAVPLLAWQFGLVNLPTGIFGPAAPMQMLVIGQPSPELITELNTQNDIVYYQEKDSAAMEVAPQEKLAKYDVVLLDQHLGATHFEKSVGRALGEALENYVKTGGNLIVVMDSGIYRSGGIYGTSVATDVVGWEANFGDMMPVECDLGKDNEPTCKQPIAVTGKVYREAQGHRIMAGIEVAPADPNYGSLTLVIFNVKPIGDKIAFIKGVTATPYYPAIVEKKQLRGKAIYFNYDPAMTPTIWSNTLEYLR